MPSWDDLSGRQRGTVAAIVVAGVAALAVIAYLILPIGGSDSSAKPKPDASTTVRPLELGVVATISPNYRVSVTEVVRYLAGPRGPFVAAAIRVKYVGSDEGEPWQDLAVEFAGSGDSRNFPSSTCPLDLGDAADLPTLAPGDAGTFRACSTLSPNRLKGGTITVAETALSTDHRVYWSTTKAVTKRLPSATTVPPTAGPTSTATPSRRPAPRTSYSPPKANADCDEFDEDEFEEYKEFGEWRKKQFEAYKDAGGDDQDDIEDYEEWEEAYDKQIEFFEKWEKVC